MTGITNHLGEIRGRMARAVSRGGRPPGSVTLIAVSKGHPATAVQSAAGAGVLNFGENYLSEALPKIAACDRDTVWHFIGRIQSNKTRDIAANFAWVQTVPAARIAQRLAAQRPPYAADLQVCIQVQPKAHSGGGAGPGAVLTPSGRGGCPRDSVAGLATIIEGLPRLKLRGLMLIPHAGLDAEALHMEYRETRALFDELRVRGHDLDTLSMGMSDDFEIAIAEGSTMVRIGTALFGPRPVAITEPAGEQE